MTKLQPIRRPHKLVTAAQATKFRKWRGSPTPPVLREAAAREPTLSAAERAQERIEDHRLQRAWRGRHHRPP